MRPFALAFVAGAFALQREAVLPEFPWLALGAALLVAGAGLCVLVRLRTREPIGRAGRHVVAVCAFATGFALGFGYAAWRAEVRLSESLPSALEGQDLVVTGVIAGLPQRSERGVRFPFHVEHAPGVPRSITLTWYLERPRAGGEAEAPPDFQAGQRWQWTVRLKRPRGAANPHGFDFEGWALERGVRATGYVRSRDGVRLVDARVAGWPYSLHRLRGEVRDAMRERLADAPLAGVLVALAIGDQDAIAPRDWEVFWRTGVGHLMSISGLHVTMLAGLAILCVHAAWVRVPALALRIPARKVAVVAGVAVALAYTLVAGYQVPAQRTFAMLAVMALCVLAGRQATASRVLCLAALAVVVLDPWAAASPGFWLSFAAVAAIFYAMAGRTGAAGWMRRAVVEQAAVTIAMLPLLIALFHEVSLVSPLANALAIPLVSLVVVPLTLAGAFLPVPGLLELAHALVAGLMAPLEALAASPLATHERHAPPPWAVACALVGCACLLAPRGLPLRALGLVWLLPLFTLPRPAPPPGAAWVDVLDVGNGLATVVRTARHALAYDAGPSWSTEADSGSRVVVPFLRGEGVRRLDALAVSHADDDHAGGAASLARLRSPGWMLASLPEGHPLQAAVPLAIPCASGQQWTWDGVTFEVLHPGSTPHRKENDRSCVLRVATRGTSMLLTGDIEARAEAELVARLPARLASDVLLVPHHGSRSSSTAPFLQAVMPAVAVVSAGHRNRHRHPHESVVARYAQSGIPLRRTDVEGALRVSLPERGAPAITGMQRACRYWSERCR